MKRKVPTENNEPSRTQQHMKDECDVNSILEKYRRTGMVTHVRQGAPNYGDFSSYQDFKSNLDRVNDAYSQFSQLPAQLRKRFRNDPAELVQFVMDAKNYDEAVLLGLIQKPVDQNATNDDKTTTNATPAQP